MRVSRFAALRRQSLAPWRKICDPPRRRKRLPTTLDDCDTVVRTVDEESRSLNGTDPRRSRRALSPVHSAAVRRPALLPIACWAAVAVTCVVIGWTDVRRARTGDTGDFVHFYHAAAADWGGRDPYAAHTRGYIYPPLLAWAAQPLSRLPIARAAGVMLAVNVTVTLATLALAAGEFRRRFHPTDGVLRLATARRAGLGSPVDVPRPALRAVAKRGPETSAIVLLALLLDVDKVKGEWQMWQTDVWMLLLFVLALRWVDRRPAWAGVALGVGANLKYLPLLLLPYLLVRRRWAAAASLAISSAALAVLPAVQFGWRETGRQWSAAVAGLTGMAGAAAPGERAEVHGVADSLSCSVTSAIARGTAGHSPLVPFALAGALGVALFVAAAAVYRRRGVPLVGPASPSVTAVEWPVLVAVLLAFSPQTNTRHLYDALLVTSAAAVLLLTPGRPRRGVLAVGMAVLAAGFTLPPGSRTVQGFWSPTVAWLRVGGPCACLLVAAGTLLWAALDGANVEQRTSNIERRKSRGRG